MLQICLPLDHQSSAIQGTFSIFNAVSEADALQTTQSSSSSILEGVVELGIILLEKARACQALDLIPKGLQAFPKPGEEAKL